MQDSSYMTFGMLIGGIGLFLLGMSLMTDGLTLVAGDGLRRALSRYTSSTTSSIATGAISTAVVQSSSATTLVTIGFVGAGALSLHAALGVVFGANVGTTVTSWIVSLVGLKVDMGAFALPMVGAGAISRLFLHGRRAALGTSLAGLGLVFVGIDVMQQAMAAASGHLDIARFVGDGPLTFGALLLLGIVMTVAMQSSSAAVATTLAAVDGGTITLLHAAALVIGQNVGTTVTAGIGAIGGGAPVRRTAVAHLVFNVATALVALLLLPLSWAVAGERMDDHDPAIVVAGFHTAFNVLGLALFAPFLKRLAKWLERQVPDEGARLTRRLEMGRGASQATVISACRLTATDVAAELARVTVAALRSPEPGIDKSLEAVRVALETTRARLNEIHANPNTPDAYSNHLAVLHGLDHLQRLAEALDEDDQVAIIHQGDQLDSVTSELVPIFDELASALDEHASGVERPDIGALSRSLAEKRRAERPRVLERTAKGELDPVEGERVLESMRWVDRLAYHLWRAIHHVDPRDVSPPSSEAP